MLVNNIIDVINNENNMENTSMDDTFNYDATLYPNFDDNDFLTQLSNDLEIPMLLDTSMDYYGLRDDSPDQIMASVAFDNLMLLNDSTKVTVPKNATVTDSQTDQNIKKICDNKKSLEEPLGDSAIFECIDELRNVDPMDWGPEAFPNLQPLATDPHYDMIQRSQQSFNDATTVTLSIEDFRALNPDMYAGLTVKEEHDVKFEPFSPNRNTPSPSDSNSSSDFSVSSYNMSEILVSKSENRRKYSLDTPPISPPSSMSPPTSPEGHDTSVTPLIIRNPAPTMKLVQIAANGNLIPIQKASPKKINIQPKPIAKNLAQISKNINKKTIVLSAEHFAALTQKVKLQNSEMESKKDVVLLNKKNGHIQPKILIKQEMGTLNKSHPNIANNLFMTVSKSEMDAQRIKPHHSGGNVFMRPKPSNELEVKAIKKQQRMIKNRESACLSRRKKKEYVTSLESQINDLSLENNHLKMENALLKERLLSYGECLSPVATQKAKRNAYFALPGNNNLRKNTAILLAMVFMVSFNIGTIGNLFSKSPEMTALDTAMPQPVHGRHLLWLGNEDTNPVLQLPNSTSNSEDSRNFDPRRYNQSTTMKKMEQLICPMYINITESIRLDTELRKWIREPEFLNWSFTEKSKQNINNDFSVKLATNLLPVYEKIDKPNPKYKLSKRKINLMKQVELVDSRNELDVFRPKAENQKYMEFFEAINRRNDTFYVVSFSYDHLLLPALAHNKTLRPKMSLMLPTLAVNDSFSTDHITMMQIDCEVINTSLIQVKQNTIPNHLRKSNNNRTANERRTDSSAKWIPQELNVQNHTELNNNINNSLPAENYKPYFINKSLDQGNIIYKNLLTPAAAKRHP